MNGFSRRSQVAERLNAVSEALAAASARAEPLLNLAESNPTSAGFAFAPERLNELLGDPRAITYAPEPFGLESAREAVAAELARSGSRVPVDQIMLTASTSEAYGYLFKLLCDPGDSVLVPSPSYPLFDMLAQLEDVRLLPYRLRNDGEWHLDPAFAQAADPRTRAVITVHPNNPTGSFLKRDELARLGSLGLPIVSDEVFAEYALGPSASRVRSALEASGEQLVFRMGGLSKSLALPQLKLAWTAIAGPPALVREATRRLGHIADAYLSPATPVQLALPRLLAEGERVRQAIQRRIEHNLGVLRRCFDQHSAAGLLAVEGGWYAILRLPAVLDDDAWVLALLEEDRVFVQPGYFYDLADGTHVVLSLITPEATLQEGARRIAARVAQRIVG